ncbi:MAG: tetratricopeptide repeat protein, partial [Pedobacter sp.]
MSSSRLAKLLEFLESDPNDPFILYALATEYNTQNDKEKAYSFYLQLTDKHP